MRFGNGPTGVRRGWVLVASLLAAITLVACGNGGQSPFAELQSPAGTYQAGDGAEGKAMDILPAGENGLVNAGEYAAYAAAGSRPFASADQIKPYNNLIYGASRLTDANLKDYYLDESFGINQSEVVRTEHPDAHVPAVIYRDKHDIPHIYGATLDAMAYDAGFAGAEDRLFLMDVLRHYGEGDLMSFVGPSCNYESMDFQSIVSKGYTQADLNSQLGAMPKRFGAVGAKLDSMIGAYVAGVNRYIAFALKNPSMMPFEYSATGTAPSPWKATDVVALSTLIAIEATGGGNEVQNAALVQYLDSQFGTAQAQVVFNDLKEQNDSAAPTTIPNRFPYMIPDRVDPSLTALPDKAPTSLTDLSGSPPELTASCTGGSGSAQQQVSAVTTSSARSQQNSQSAAKVAGHVAGPVSAEVSGLTASYVGALKTRSSTAGGNGRADESNGVVLSADHSTDGHPIAVFGPELGYYGPEILMQEDLHAPGYAAAGAAFPGANFLVELGRGTDYAWSATTASTDQVDMRVERLCRPDGGPPPAQGTFYEFKGRCLAMTSHQFTESSTGSPAVSITRTLRYTVHGVVQGWSSVDGKPVAIARQDATTGHDLDQFAGYLQFGTPSISSTPQGWMQAVTDVAYSFNWLYLNSTDIAYDVSGRDPLRPSHVDPNFPTWGTGGAEWKGFLSPAQRPHAVNPSQGYLVSWNNKPAPGYSASDDLYAWGPVFRSQLLDTGLHASLGVNHGKLTRAQLATVVEDAASQDLDAFTLIKPVLGLLGSDLGTVAPTGVRQMAGQLDQWATAGFHRRKGTPSSVQYSQAAAVAIWDQVYPALVEAFFDPVFAAGGAEGYMGLPDGYDVMPMLYSETPDDVGLHDGDGFYSGWEGYVLTALDQLSGKPVGQPFSPALLGRLCATGAGATSGPSLHRCQSGVLAAFEQAYQTLVMANGGSTDVASWTMDTNTVDASAGSGQTVTMPQFDQIQFNQVGAIALPSMDWQNRPTYQQVVEFPSIVP